MHAVVAAAERQVRARPDGQEYRGRLRAARSTRHRQGFARTPVGRRDTVSAVIGVEAREDDLAIHDLDHVAPDEGGGAHVTAPGAWVTTSNMSRLHRGSGLPARSQAHSMHGRAMRTATFGATWTM